jgi:gentisate 1,2-dioxygenase
MAEQMSADTQTSTEEERQEFYGRLDPQHVKPLWVEIRKLLARVPQPKAVPHRWVYQDVRPLLMESGDLITAEEAERRVLILENPALEGLASTTDTLYAGLQLILPGEIAPAHRHSPSALRFIVEGTGAYTAVDGERAYMEEGDLILTPSWTWHDHGCDGDSPMVWLDGLDIPTIRFMAVQFAEDYPEPTFPESRPSGDALARYGSNMLPVDVDRGSKNSPVFRYPYEQSRAALEQMQKSGEIDLYEGLKLEYINPATGGPVMPTMSCFMQMLPKGFKTEPYRSTDSTVFSVVEGSGTVQIGDVKFSWTKRDVFAVPTWMQYQISTNEDSVLFSFSDRVAQKSLGLWREQKGNK